MESEITTSHEKLNEMYREGKIDQNEYEMLKNSMIKTDANKESPPSSSPPLNYAVPCPQQTTALHNGIPWQIWTYIAFLFVSTIFNVIEFIEKAPLMALFCVVMNGALGVGLYLKHRWAFVLIIVLSILSIYSITKFPVSALISIVFGVILFTAHSHFFKKGLRDG